MESNLLLDLLLSPWFRQLLYQIMSNVFFLYRMSDRPKKGCPIWIRRAQPSTGPQDTTLDVSVSCSLLFLPVSWWYIFCPDKLLTSDIFIGELHRTRDQYKSGHHSCSKCKFVFTVVDVHVSLFSASDSVKYTLIHIMPRQIINTRYFL